MRRFTAPTMEEAHSTYSVSFPSRPRCRSEREGTEQNLGSADSNDQPSKDVEVGEYYSISRMRCADDIQVGGRLRLFINRWEQITLERRDLTNHKWFQD